MGVGQVRFRSVVAAILFTPWLTLGCAGVCPTITVDLHGCAVIKYHDQAGVEQSVRVSHADIDDIGRQIAAKRVSDGGL